MTDPTPSPTTTPTSPDSEAATPSFAPTDEHTIVILTTDSLSQERLQEIADSCVLTYEPAEGGGILIHVQDDDDARFWQSRGRIWGHLYDEVPAS